MIIGVWRRSMHRYLLIGKLSGSIDNISARDGLHRRASDEYPLLCTRYLPDVLFPMMNDDEAPLPGCFVFVSVAEASEDRWIRWARNRMMDPAWLTEPLAPLFLSISPYAKAVISRSSIPVAFMIYRCSRLSFAVSYADLARYISWRGRFYCFIPCMRAAGCLRTPR